MKKKLLNYTLYCVECKVECIETEKGILCPACGASVSNEEIGLDENFS